MAQKNAGAPTGGRRRSKGRGGAVPRKRAATPRRTKDERELDVILTAIARPSTRQQQVSQIAKALRVERSRAETMRARGLEVLRQRRTNVSDEALEQIERLRTVAGAAFAAKKWNDCVRAEQLLGQIAGTVDSETNRPSPPMEPVDVRITVVARGDLAPKPAG